MDPAVAETELLLERHMSQVSQSLVEVELEEYFEVSEELGSGSFGLVLKAQDQATGHSVALKCLVKGLTSLKSFLEEYAIAFHLSSHPSIIGCYGVCFQTVDHYVLAQELSPIGDLFSLIEDQVGIPERKVKRCADQVSSALNFMHSNGLIHRDVKPENVLVLDTECRCVKVTDFGMTRMKGTTVHARTGTVPYMAPELFQPGLLEADSCLDVWAFGVLLFTVLTGTLPWEEAVLGDGDYQSFVEWMNLGVSTIPCRWNRLTLESLAMFGSLLKHNPMERGSMLEVLKFLDVPWTVDAFLNDGMEEADCPETSQSMSSWSDGSLTDEASSYSDSNSEEICEPPETDLIDQWKDDSTGLEHMVDGSSRFIAAEEEVS